MAILYVFKTNDPNNVGVYPPSVTASDWFVRLKSFFDKNQISSTEYSNSLLFANETELNTFLNTYRCTDSTLLADIAAWKSAHGVSYSSQYFTLTDAGVSTSPIVS